MRLLAATVALLLGCLPCAVDADHDGFTDDVDCDDDDPRVHWGAAERCGDGVDQDCDGEIDEGCEVAYALPVADR